MKQWFALALALALLFTGSLARAETCGDGELPWVLLQFSDDPWEQGFEEATLGNLRAGLLDRGVNVCPSSDTAVTEPLGRVRVSRLGDAQVRIEVESQSGKKHETSQRDVDLGNLPADGRAFAVGVAADELVRATWGELVFQHGPPEPAPPDSAPAPPEPAAAPPTPAAPKPERPRNEPVPSPKTAVALGAHAAGEHYGGGIDQLGADLSLVRELSERLDVEGSLLLRWALGQTAPDGSVSARAMGVSARMRHALLDSGSVRLDGEAAARLSWLQLEGRPEGGGTGSAHGRPLFELAAGLSLGVLLSDGVRLRLGAGGGAPVGRVQLTDGGDVVTAYSGLGLYGRLGVEMHL